MFLMFLLQLQVKDFNQDLQVKSKHTLPLLMSRIMRKPTMWFSNRSDTNWFVPSQKMARSFKFWIYKVEELYYRCSKNKGADQLRGYQEADLRLCFRIYADC